MTFYSGQNGRMQLRTSAANVTPEVFTTLGKVTNWSISSQMSPLATTTLEDTDQTFVSGVRTTTGNCRLFYYNDTAQTPTVNSAKTMINKLIKARTAGADPGVADEPDVVVLKLEVVDGTTSAGLIQVEALITEVQMAMAVGEVLAADISFQCNGAPVSVTI